MKIKQVSASLLEARPKGSLNKSTIARQQASSQQVTQKTDAEVEKKAEKQLGSDVEVLSNPGQIERTLSKLLKINKAKNRRGEGDFQNILFEGPAGTGKTSRIKAWAKANNINLVTVIASAMDETDLGGILMRSEDKPGTAGRLSTTEFDELDNVPDSVLFLDEYNRAPAAVRAPLLSLIQDHVVRDDRVKGKSRVLKHFLFTIAAVNPDDGAYNVIPLDDAENSRFKKEYVVHDNISTRDYIIRSLQHAIDNEEDKELILMYKGQQKLANTILSSKDFSFDNQEDIRKSKQGGNGLITTARSLTNAIEGCDGTKKDFLDGWDGYCNSLKKPIVATILQNYVDVEDEATGALDSHESESPMFKKLQSAADKLTANGIFD